MALSASATVNSSLQARLHVDDLSYQLPSGFYLKNGGAVLSGRDGFEIVAANLPAHSNLQKSQAQELCLQILRGDDLQNISIIQCDFKEQDRLTTWNLRGQAHRNGQTLEWLVLLIPSPQTTLSFRTTHPELKVIDSHLSDLVALQNSLRLEIPPSPTPVATVTVTATPSPTPTGKQTQMTRNLQWDVPDNWKRSGTAQITPQDLWFRTFSTSRNDPLQAADLKTLFDDCTDIKQLHFQGPPLRKTQGDFHFWWLSGTGEKQGKPIQWQAFLPEAVKSGRDNFVFFVTWSSPEKSLPSREALDFVAQNLRVWSY